jgi:hypothetical protein
LDPCCCWLQVLYNAQMILFIASRSTQECCCASLFGSCHPTTDLHCLGPCCCWLQVLYNAQMIRTWSLLLRTSHRRGYIVAGRFDATALVESPYLMHPIEHKTAGWVIG